MEMPDIGKTIKTGRLQNGWSQRELAEKIGVTTGAICAWEKNIRTPSGDALIKMARVLGITHLLFEESSPPNIQPQVREPLSPYFPSQHEAALYMKVQEILQNLNNFNEKMTSIENRLEVCEKKLAGGEKRGKVEKPKKKDERAKKKVEGAKKNENVKKVGNPKKG